MKLSIIHKLSISASIVCKTMKQASKSNKDYLFLLPLILIFEVLVPFPIILLPKRIIDSLVISKDLYAALVNAVILTGATLLLNGILAALRSKRSLSIERMKQSFLQELSEKTMTAPYIKIEDRKYMEKVVRAKAAINGESTWTVTLMKGDKGLEAIGSELTNILAGLIKIAGAVYILTELNALIVICICLVVAISAVSSSVKKKADYNRRIRTSGMGDQAQYYKETILNPNNGKEIRLNVMQKYLLEKNGDLRSKFINARFKKISTNIVADSVRVFFSGIQEFIIYAYLIIQVIIHGMTIGSFTLYATTIQSLSQFITQLIDSILNLNLFCEYLVDYFDIVEMETDAMTTHNSSAVLRAPESSHTIEFRDVWFQYPDTDEYALKGVSIIIHQGEKLSVVGANGAGKTSFVKLLMRLYKPQRGAIYLDGIDIQQYSMESYLKGLSAVFQDYAIFDFTVEENVALSDASDANTVWEALQKANIAQRINQFPHKLHTYLSKRYFSDGEEMSQGQQQKIAIARAFYRNAGTIILDEPTAALDPVAENELYQDLDSLIQHKTVIFISHRMAGSRFCDNVAVFDAGEIVEYGSHEELMKKDGLYAVMFHKQAQYYEEELHA